MKIVNLWQDSSLLRKGFILTIQNETKEQRGGFLAMFLGTLGTSLLEQIRPGEAAIAARRRACREQQLVKED